MDVSNIARVFQGFAQYAFQAKNTLDARANAQSSQSKSSSESFGEATEVELSSEGKAAAAAAATETQTAKQPTTDLSVEDESTQSTKGLSADEVRYLEESLATSEQTMLNMMIQALTDSNDKLQGWLDEGTGILNFGGVQIDAARFGLPEVATNPEDAAKAVADGGEWSVDAVSTRIFDLATAIAGNDPEKLSAMKAAVEEGFKQAGLTWTNATGLSNMPDITKNTYDEIMSRFDKRTNEINGTSVVE